jgi:1-acyl-sn-glycerol-3-phosphate acyltransferase
MVLQKIIYTVAKTFFRVIFTVYNRLETRGLGRIPRGVPLIVASNHASYIDPPLIGGVFPGRLRYLAKESLFRNPIFGSLIRTLGAMPVSRYDSQKAGAALKLMLNALALGDSVLIFPEGTRSPDGTLQPLEEGAAFLSVKSGIPLLPVYIGGSSRVWPPHKALPRPAKVTVTFGEPILPSGEGGERERRSRLTKALAEALRSLEELEKKKDEDKCI